MALRIQIGTPEGLVDCPENLARVKDHFGCNTARCDLRMFEVQILQSGMVGAAITNWWSRVYVVVYDPFLSKGSRLREFDVSGPIPTHNPLDEVLMKLPAELSSGRTVFVWGAPRGNNREVAHFDKRIPRPTLDVHQKPIELIAVFEKALA